jgi:hypothetical protein
MAATGLAHVATVSFLASRVAPSGQFWLALAGGVAVARASAVHGLRTGVGVSAAATLQTVAVMGPTRVNAPLTQALSAPVLGRMEARGAGPVSEFAATLAIRLAHYAVLTALFIWVVLGGLDAFTGSYDTVAGWLGLGTPGLWGALALTAAGNVAWAVFFSAVQVALYRRALRAWPAEREDTAPAQAHRNPSGEQEPRAPHLPPRVLAAIAIAATALLLATTAWWALAAVSAGLVAGWVLARAETGPIALGAGLAALLALSALTGSLLADLGLDEAARRALRAALLVGVATWLRAAAGPAGLRTLFGDLLRWARRIPGAPEAAALLEHLDSGPRLLAAARAVPDHLRGVRHRPAPVADAVIGWVAAESSRYRASPVSVRTT